MHEWSPSLNEQELTPVLPSNRETGCLSETRIKMDALYFLPRSVREQDKRGVKEEEEEEWTQGEWGLMGTIRKISVNEKQQYTLPSKHGH